MILHLQIGIQMSQHTIIKWVKELKTTENLFHQMAIQN